MEPKWPSEAFTASAGKKQGRGLGIQPPWGPRLYNNGRRDSATPGGSHSHVSAGAAAAGPGAVTRLRAACVPITALLLLA